MDVTRSARLAARCTVVVLLLLVAGCTGPPPAQDEDGTPSTGARAPHEAPVFGEPSVVAHQVPRAGVADEPTVAAAPDGTIYVSAKFALLSDYLAGTPGNTRVWRSTDDGATFTLLNDLRGGLVQDGQGNQDTDLYVDPEGGVHVADLFVPNGPGRTSVPYLRSTDQGETWEEVATFGIDGKSQDRQWIAGADDTVVVIWRALPGAIGLALSHDRGETWNVTALEVDHRKLGNVVIADDTIVFAYLQGEATVEVMRSEDSGATWTNATVPGVPAGTTGILFPSVTIDAAGNGYVAMAYATRTDNDWSDSGIYLARALAGEPWEPLERVTSAPHALMPSLVAGDPGHVALSFLVTDDAGGMEQEVHEWHVQVHATNEADRNATWSETRVGTEPAHEGNVCVSGGNCPLFGRAPMFPDRTMGEIFESGMAPDGSLLLTWPDTSHGPGSQAAILFAKQTGGTRLRSSAP